MSTIMLTQFPKFGDGLKIIVTGSFALQLVKINRTIQYTIKKLPSQYNFRFIVHLYTGWSTCMFIIMSKREFTATSGHNCLSVATVG